MLPPGSSRQQALQSVAQGYLQSDSEAAIKWIESLKPSERSKALSGSLDQLARTDPEMAAKLFSETPMNNNNGHAITIATGLANKSTDREIEWIETLPSGQARQNAVSGLVQTWGQTDPSEAAKFLDGEGLTQRNAHMAGSLVTQWMGEDRDAAIDWIFSHENSSVQQNLVSNMVRQWAHQDPQAAMEFVETLEDPSLKKTATLNMISNLGHQDPDTALEWIQKQEGDDQAGYVANLISSMAHNDHNRAAEIYQEYLPTLTEEHIDGEFSSAVSNRGCP
ncbi:hypothetical protein N9260_01600, partial [bacterium]|nr:hypothetical protein [bacterium]